MKRRNVLVFMLGLSVFGSGLAANWTSFVGASDTTAEIDTNSIVRAGSGLLKAWVRYSFADIQKSTGYPAFQYRSIVQLKLYDCSQRTTDLLQEVYYGAPFGEGAVVQTNTYPRRATTYFTDVVPGSVGEGALDLACTFVKTKRKR